MRRLVEPIAFLCIASAVHAGVWFGFGDGAAPGAGSGGEAMLSLEAAGGDLVAMVQRWDQPPTVDSIPTAIDPPPAQAIPSAPVADRAAPVTLPHIPTSPAPTADMAPLPQYAETAPRPDPVRPRPRPEARPEPATRTATAAAATPAQPAQRAAGTGQRQAAGQSGTSAAAQPSSGQLRALEAEWGGKILARIARAQRYPSGNHGNGTVRVTLSVGRDGALQSVGISGSSGSAALDLAALDAVRRAGRFPTAPRGLAKAAYVFRVPMTFRRN